METRDTNAERRSERTTGSEPAAPESAILKITENLSKDGADRERLELRAEIDGLRLEIAALQAALERVNPGFEHELASCRANLRDRYDPDCGKTVGST